MTSNTNESSQPSTPSSGGSSSGFSTPSSTSGGSNPGTNVSGTSATPSGANVVVPKMTKPHMGNLDKDGKAWTGGEPTDKSWKSTKSQRPNSGYAYRTGVDFRQYGARLKGLDPKFSFKTAPTSEDISLPSFAAEVKRHLVQHGMDSVFWIEDMSGELHDIISSYALYTVDDVLAGMLNYTNKYDEYDRDNLNDSATFLLNSIEANLKKLITPFLKDEISGPEIWIRIVSELQSSSVERMIKVAADFEKVRVKSFKGENVKQYAMHVMQLCRDMEFGESLPRNVCLTITDQLIEVSVEKFRMEFLAIRPTIVEELRLYHGRSVTAIRTMQIVNKHFTYEKLLSKATGSYQTLVDLGQWGPAGNIRDRTGAPEAMYTHVEVNALAQKMVAKFKKDANRNTSGGTQNKIKCFNCGKEGHKKSECRSKAVSGQWNNNRNNNNKPGGFKKVNWLSRPPRHGEPQSKVVDGEERHWCSKCGRGRWTKTHGTLQHVDSPNRGETNAAEASNHTGLRCDWAQDAWGEINVMEVRPFSSMGPCPRCSRIGPLGATCMGTECAKYKPVFAINHIRDYFKGGFDLFDDDDSDATVYGNCVNCDREGPVGMFCTSDECEDSGAIYDAPYIPSKPSVKPAPKPTPTPSAPPKPNSKPRAKAQPAAPPSPKPSTKSSNKTKVDCGFYVHVVDESDWGDDMGLSWASSLGAPLLPLFKLFQYNVELTWLSILNWMSMSLSAVEGCPFPKQFCFNSELTFLVSMSWWTLISLLVEKLFCFLFYHIPLFFLPLFEGGRVSMMKNLVNRDVPHHDHTHIKFSHDTQQHHGSCIPLLSYPKCIVVVSCFHVSLQTAYGMLGPAWQGFGERRLVYWNRCMDKYDIETCNKEANNDNNKTRGRNKRNKRKKQMSNNEEKRWQDAFFREPSCNTFSAPVAATVQTVQTMFKHKRQDDETIEVLWDTGATLSVSPFREDFITEIERTKEAMVMKGIAKGLMVQGIGQVSYAVEDDKGNVVTLTSPAYFVPQATRRIFSPQAFFQETEEKASSVQSSEGIVLHLEDKTLTIPYNKINNLPIIKVLKVGKEISVSQESEKQVCANPCVTEEANQNLSTAQKELLKFHFKLGHMDFKCVQMALKSGHLGTSPLIKAASKCEIPKCASCRFGKARRRGTGYQGSKEPKHPISISTDALRPGQRVSMDHFVVKQKGRLLESRGKTQEDQMYNGGCLFYEHSSAYIFVMLQVLMNAIETIEAKIRFEREMFDYGVVVQGYHTDNGIFSSQQFIQEIENSFQTVRYSGVGGHHQNGNAERSIGTIFAIARTIMIHWAIRWPEVFDMSFWPMAVHYSIWLYNRVPKSNGIAPIELIVRSKNARHVLQQAHVFGCPCYVLDPKLQSLSKLPKFTPRSNRGVFVGFSPKHSSTVPLVLNLKTLAITAQFHVLFDDWFTTVESTSSTSTIDDCLIKLFESDRYQYSFDDDDDAQLSNSWREDDTTERFIAENNNDNDANNNDNDANNNNIANDRPEEQVTNDNDNNVPAASVDQREIISYTTSKTPTIISSPQNSTSYPSSSTSKPIISPSSSPTAPSSSPTTASPKPSTPTVASYTPSIISPSTLSYGTEKQILFPDTAIPLHRSTYGLATGIKGAREREKVKVKQEATRKSNRETKEPIRWGYDGSQSHGYLSETYRLQRERKNETVNFIKDLAKSPRYNYIFNAYLPDVDEGSVELYLGPSVYASIPTSSTNGNNTQKDSLKYHEAIREPDWPEFQKAMELEIRTLEQLGTWKEVSRASVPTGKRVLGGTWVFRRKRNPEGKVTKYKARYCVRGDQQIAGEDYFETYAPVTMWSTVRMCFILALIFSWFSMQVDYTNAFAQALLKELVYIEVPVGFSGSKMDTVLLLIKSLYGLVQAPRTFYEHLTAHLTKYGYECQPNIDPCLWINKKRKIICVIWVDDCLFFCNDKNQILESINELKTKMPLTVENSVDAFLGIKIEKTADTYELTQPGLIQKVIDSANMTDCNPAKTPAVHTPIGSDIGGINHNETWEYNSIVGMLMFLANNSRPDIAFAVHQCARFTHAPKHSHSLAVKRIIRYLQGTKDKGIIMRPTSDLTIDCYVDADFAGLYGVENDQSSLSVKSRTGYVLLLANCPLLWVSRLQTEIASSTMEAEYIALSQSVKDLIPLRRLLKLICETVLKTNRYNATMHSSIFEDNNGALQLARAPRMTPRTKHYGIKYHFFREYVTNGDLKLFKVESANQKADIFTKGLVQAIFEVIRKLLMGW